MANPNAAEEGNAESNSGKLAKWLKFLLPLLIGPTVVVFILTKLMEEKTYEYHISCALYEQVRKSSGRPFFVFTLVTSEAEPVRIKSSFDKNDEPVVHTTISLTKQELDVVFEDTSLYRQFAIVHNPTRVEGALIPIELKLVPVTPPPQPVESLPAVSKDVSSNSRVPVANTSDTSSKEEEPREIVLPVEPSHTIHVLAGENSSLDGSTFICKGVFVKKLDPDGTFSLTKSEFENIRSKWDDPVPIVLINKAGQERTMRHRFGDDFTQTPTLIEFE